MTIKRKKFDIDKNIQIANKTGKIIYGEKQVMKELYNNTFEMLITASNIPQSLDEQLSYYNSLKKNKLFLYKFEGSSWDLGLACAKSHMISVIGVIDPGVSDLLSLKIERN